MFRGERGDGLAHRLPALLVLDFLIGTGAVAGEERGNIQVLDLAALGQAGAEAIDCPRAGQHHEPSAWRASRLVEGVGLPPDLRVDIQCHFFRGFTIPKDLKNEAVDLGTGAVIQRGECRLITLCGLCDEQSPFCVLGVGCWLHLQHRNSCSLDDQRKTREKM